jgi:hypothetical protein
VVEQVTKALLAAAGAQKVDMATNTGGVPGAGSKTMPKIKSPLSAQQIVDRMRISYPALRACKVDSGMRQLFLAQLVTQSFNQAESVVVPEGTMV